MSTIYEIKIGTSVYTVNEPDVLPENWLTIKEEKYRPDKSKFIFEEFKKVYPSIKVKDSDQVYALASRSSTLNEWLSKTNLKYALQENSPTFYRSYVDIEKFNEADAEVKRINSLNADKAKEQAVAASEYRLQLDEIDKKYSSKIETSNSIAKILSLNTTSLPLTIQLAIDNYTPAKSSSPNQRTYARECLINYKIALLKAFNKDPKIDIDKLIKDNQVK